MSDSFDMTRVDNRSEKLTNEFNDILDEFKKNMPDAKNEIVFQGWAIQKIAGLQICIEILKDEIERLRLVSDLKIE